MTRQEIHISGTTDADPAAVWHLLVDSSTWPAWTPIETFELERPAGQGGAGEIRRFTTGRLRLREEVIEARAPTRLTYRLLSGLGVRNYQAQVDLVRRDSPDPVRTDIHWRTTFSAKVPGLGGLYRRVIEKATQQFVDGLVAHSMAQQDAADVRTIRPFTSSQLEVLGCGTQGQQPADLEHPEDQEQS
ncbi:SRPBCC family protein [Aeromicrobium sp.]|uniref:SRPBCC family protein n=1 Tax=Aeromicrobium sp. TaxID=1871063 RepID=UPI0030C37DA2